MQIAEMPHYDHLLVLVGLFVPADTSHFNIISMFLHDSKFCHRLLKLQCLLSYQIELQYQKSLV